MQYLVSIVQRYRIPIPVSYFIYFRRDQNRLARLLPNPLYVMYTQLFAFNTACDELLKVEVRIIVVRFKFSTRG